MVSGKISLVEANSVTPVCALRGEMNSAIDPNKHVNMVGHTHTHKSVSALAAGYNTLNIGPVQLNMKVSAM